MEMLPAPAGCYRQIERIVPMARFQNIRPGQASGLPHTAEKETLHRTCPSNLELGWSLAPAARRRTTSHVSKTSGLSAPHASGGSTSARSRTVGPLSQTSGRSVGHAARGMTCWRTRQPRRPPKTAANPDPTIYDQWVESRKMLSK
jgi:hypothetical protein